MMVNLPIEHSDTYITPFGSISLHKRFIEKIEVDDFLEGLPLPTPESNLVMLQQI